MDQIHNEVILGNPRLEHKCTTTNTTEGDLSCDFACTVQSLNTTTSPELQPFFLPQIRQPSNTLISLCCRCFKDEHAGET